MILFLCVLVLAVYSHMLFVCFFNQKTAYEMRISDWSSDVCSSDLSTAFPQRPKEERPFDELRANGFEKVFVTLWLCANRKSQWCEIGRASCRERVCQYV